MRLGLFAGYWGLGISGEEQLEMAQEADRLGYDSIWAAEAYGSDAATVLAWLASNTERAKIASGIFQMPARTPAMTAMTAATLDNISGGRFMLGLGISGPQVVEGWHGQPFDRPLARTREYVDDRAQGARPRDAHLRRRVLQAAAPRRPGQAAEADHQARCRSGSRSTSPRSGPKNTALAAEIADGWLPTIFAPEHFDAFRPSLEEGAARGGPLARRASTSRRMISMAIYDDVEQARNFMRPFLALYIGGMGSREKNFYNQLVTRYGYGDAAREVQDLYLVGQAGGRDGRDPGELIDKVALCGPKEAISERLDVYRDAGVGTLLVTPAGREPGGPPAGMLRDLAEVGLRA